jgi:prephenate dehydrogenase
MINKIGIIGGTGKMGSSFRKVFTKIGYDVIVSDEKTKDLEKVILNTCDWIILTVPIDKTLSVYKTIKEKISKNQVFSDFTSVKSILKDELKKSNYEIISCHPLFGPLNDFKGQNIITIPVKNGKKYKYIKEIFNKIGLNTTEINSLKEHDKYMSIIQGMTHFSHVCFTTAMKKINPNLDKIMEICSPIYLSNIAFSSRITGGDENLYTNIIMDNPINEEVIKTYLETSKELYKMIQGKEYNKFKDNFKENRKYLKNHISKMIKQSDYLVNKMAEFKSGSK